MTAGGNKILSNALGEETQRRQIREPFNTYDVVMKIEELDHSALVNATAIWSEADLTRPWNDPDEDFRRALKGENSAVLGAFVNGELAGTVMVGDNGHRGWMYYLAVARGHRGEGIGRALVKAGENWLRSCGAVKVQLMVRNTIEQGSVFYRRLGYEDAQTSVLARWLDEEA